MMAHYLQLQSLRDSLSEPSGGSLWDGIKQSMPSLSFAYKLLIWKSHFNCEVQINCNSDGSQDSHKVGYEQRISVLFHLNRSKVDRLVINL